jgi:pyruvate formate lyase activating enzyme
MEEAKTPSSRYWKALDETRIQCTLCPNNCVIRNGKTGICGVRQNDDNHLTLPFYGRASAIALDPVEKKPLYHFHPGKPILSIGFLGCSLRCPFCQNYSISQSTRSRTEYVSPEELVETAQSRDSFAVAYTYNEPTIHAEYILEAATRARRSGLKNVLVTAGYANSEAADELLSVVDAANIDLKGFQPQFYSKELGAELDPVKRFIRDAASRIHVEVTTLVIPGKNDSEDEIEAMAAFLADQSPDIPYHLSAYYPTYKYTREATEASMILRLKSVAEKHLRFVYPGNIRGEADTKCPQCGHIVVKRQGYLTETSGLTQGSCANCGNPIPVIAD